jgi:hypothetical protein
MIDEVDYVELGLACADVCRALDRSLNGNRVDDFGLSALEAMDQWMR